MGLGTIRKFILKKLILKNKVLILDAGIGLLPIFAWRYNENILSLEKNKVLREIGNSILNLFSKNI